MGPGLVESGETEADDAGDVDEPMSFHQGEAAAWIDTMRSAVHKQFLEASCRAPRGSAGVGILWYADSGASVDRRFARAVKACLEKMEGESMSLVLPPEVGSELKSVEQVQATFMKSALDPDALLFRVKPWSVLWEGGHEARSSVGQLVRKMGPIAASGDKADRKRMIFKPLDTLWGATGLLRSSHMPDVQVPTVGFEFKKKVAMTSLRSKRGGETPASGEEGGGMGKDDPQEGEEASLKRELSTETPGNKGADDSLETSIREVSFRTLGPKSRISERGDNFRTRLLELARHGKDGKRVWDHLIIAELHSHFAQMPICMLPLMQVAGVGQNPGHLSLTFDPLATGLSYVGGNLAPAWANASLQQLQAAVRKMIEGGTWVPTSDGQAYQNMVSAKKKQTGIEERMQTVWETLASQMHYFELQDASDAFHTRCIKRPRSLDWFCKKHGILSNMLQEFWDELPQDVFADCESLPAAGHSVGPLPEAKRPRTGDIRQFMRTVVPASDSVSAAACAPVVAVGGISAEGAISETTVADRVAPVPEGQDFDQALGNVLGKPVEVYTCRARDPTSLILYGWCPGPAQAVTCKKGELLWHDGGAGRVSRKSPDDASQGWQFQLSGQSVVGLINSIAPGALDTITFMSVGEAVQKTLAEYVNVAEAKDVLLGHNCAIVSPGKVTLRLTKPTWWYRPHTDAGRAISELMGEHRLEVQARASFHQLLLDCGHQCSYVFWP